MEKNREDQSEKIARLEDEIKTLPPNAQKAFYWAVEHFDELGGICDDPDITLEKLPGMMEKAWTEESYALFMLLSITRFKKMLQNGNGDP